MDLINEKLNEDCFIHLFSFLNIPDIINTTLVCKNFRKMAIATFPSKFNEVKLIGPPFSMTQEQTTILFTTFGGHIHKLNINAVIFELDHEHISRIALTLLKEYCPLNLRELSLSQFYFPQISKKIFEKFNSLNKLQLSMVTLNLMTSEIINHNEDIETLVIHHCTNVKFFYELPENYRVISDLKKFISRGNLQMYSLYILDNIHINMPNLQELEINDKIRQRIPMELFINFLPNIGYLKNLSKLTINFLSESATPLLEELTQNKINLTHLTIIESTVDTYTLEKVAEIQSLQYLRFSEINGLQPAHVINLISTLIQLNELILHLLELDLSPFIPQHLGQSIKNLKKLGLYHILGQQITLNEYIHIFGTLEKKLTIEVSSNRLSSQSLQYICANKVHELVVIKNNDNSDSLIDEEYDIN